VGVSKATPCMLWRDRHDMQGADFGASQLVNTNGVLIHSSSHNSAWLQR
jgi:hypothetical protein